MTTPSVRRRRARFGLAGLQAVLLAGTASAMAQEATPAYAPVTDERLTNPEPENWLQYRGNYAGWGYSPLDQITAETVKNLVPVWTFSTGLDEGHQAPPIVNNGTMFVSTPQNNVIALDAKTGETQWRYRRELPEELFQLHPTNRGVALYDDKVYMATADACVVALDAVTGDVAWDKCIADWGDGYYMTLSPMVADGKVVVGVSGGEFGIRGFITALDTQTGEEVWKTYTVPGPGERGHETWTGDAWKTGGGSRAATTRRATSPISAPATVARGCRTRGRATASTQPRRSVDMETGAIEGHHQYHWNDAWDWDEVSAPVLLDIEREGRTIPAAVHAGRNGYLWVLERTPNGQMAFIDADPFVQQNVFQSIDPETGRPSYDPARIPGTGKRITFCPGLWGGKDWPPEAYNPDTGLFYLPSNNNLCSELGGVEVSSYEPGDFYIGVPLDKILTSLRASENVDASRPFEIGAIQAWNLDTGEMVWKHGFEDMATWGPLLTTAGNLLFTGGTPDRMFRALDATTGEGLWQMKLNSGVIGVPSSFMVDGVQYVAVQAGWGVDADRMYNGLGPLLGTRSSGQDVPQGGVIWVFALQDQAVPDSSGQSGAQEGGAQ